MYFVFKWFGRHYLLFHGELTAAAYEKCAGAFCEKIDGRRSTKTRNVVKAVERDRTSIQAADESTKLRLREVKADTLYGKVASHSFKSNLILG